MRSFIVSMLIGLCFIALTIGTHPWNSDLFYIESILRDALTHAYPLSEFHYSASTFLFPDFPLFIGLRAMSANLNLVLMGYMGVLFALLLTLFHKWTPHAKSWTLLVVPIFYFGFFDITWYSLFYPVYHGGQWILGLLLLFTYGPLQSKNKWAWVLTSLFSSFLASTDLLYGINGIAPYCLLMMSTWKLKERRAQLRSDLLWSVLTFVLVFVFYFLFRKLTGAYFGWNKPVPGAWGRGLEFVHEFIRPSLFTLTMIFTLGFLLLRAKTDQVARFLLLSVFLSAISIILTGVWAGHENVRYFYPLPIAMVYAVLLLVSSPKLRDPKLIALVSVAALYLSFTQAKTLWNGQKENPFHSPYLSSNECLDRFVKETGIKEGIGDYWSSKWASFLSRESAKVLQVNANRERFYWINNHEWYQNFKPRFAIVNYFSSGALNATHLEGLPEPERKVDCERFQIWLYPEGVTLIQEPREVRKYKNFQEFRN